MHIKSRIYIYISRFGYIHIKIHIYLYQDSDIYIYIYQAMVRSFVFLLLTYYTPGNKKTIKLKIRTLLH